MGTTIKAGDLVGWKNPNHAEGEQNDRMLVIEVNGDRCFVQDQMPGMRIQPQRVVRVAELEVIK